MWAAWDYAARPVCLPAAGAAICVLGDTRSDVGPLCVSGPDAPDRIWRRLMASLQVPDQYRRVRAVTGVAFAVGALVAAFAAAPPAQARSVHVWRVGSWHGIPGNRSSIEAAVASARPGDWILVGPGDYHPRMDYTAAQRGSEHPAGVLITTPDVHLRGMDRNGVVIDGTKAGSAACSASPLDQDYGVPDASGSPSGRNGVEAFKVNGVSVENLTVCNFLSGSAGSGNEIWWNGGDDSGAIGMGAWRGSYLSATSTFYDPAAPGTAAQYGLFASNASGPGLLEQTYASNFSDGGYYIGACPDCDAVINHAHAQYNALGYSGTNSGGRLVIENSEFDHNKDGFDTNSQNSADAPSPQDGACPGGGIGQTGTHSCWVFEHNYVHDNNNADVPQSGDAAHGPVGTGISLAGARHDTVINNRFVNNGSWAILTSVFPDAGPASPANVPNCRGGVPDGSFLGLTVPCLFNVFGNEIAGNTFQNNGWFGNPTNGDLADLSTPPAEAPGAAGDCFHDNTEVGGGPASSWPFDLQSTQGTCGAQVYPDPASNAVLGAEVLCATEAFGPCPPGVPNNYPRQEQVVMPPLAPQLTMPDPCVGVPGHNPWCMAHGHASPDSASSAAVAGTPALVAVRRDGPN